MLGRNPPRKEYCGDGSEPVLAVRINGRVSILQQTLERKRRLRSTKSRMEPGRVTLRFEFGIFEFTAMSCRRKPALKLAYPKG